ncbi:putative signal transducing protein [Chloroflexota bacterium]
MNEESNFVVITKVQGDIIANVLKTHLESEGIPVILEYESLGKVYGITVDGLGEVRILVPQECAEEAKSIIEPIDINE